MSGHDCMRSTHATDGDTTKTMCVTMLKKTMFYVVRVAKSGENVKKRRVSDKCSLFAGDKTVSVRIEKTVVRRTFGGSRGGGDSTCTATTVHAWWINLRGVSMGENSSMSSVLCKSIKNCLLAASKSDGEAANS